MLIFFLPAAVLSAQNYDSLGRTCYVDSSNGNDGNDGLSESSPKRTLAAVPSDCAVVRFKRGSVYQGRLDIPYSSNIQVYTNYGRATDPLPHFMVSHDPGQGPVIITFKGPITFDGLYLSGARGDNTMVHDFTPDSNGKIDGIVGGVAAFLGGATTFINNEIDDSDIGIMVAGQNTLVKGNYVHDLIMGIDEEPGVDPNLVGGAEGIFVNTANCEVCYNSFVNCTGPARWVGGFVDCDGGATEISAQATDDPNANIYNVHIHHNYSYNCCGFFEVASFFDDSGQNRRGTVRDISLHDNVIIDSGWMGLLQVNNTILRNVQFYNNTLIQRPGSVNEGMLWSIFTATSSGFTGGVVDRDTVFLTNNLFVLDRVTPDPQFQIHENFNSQNNIVRTYSGTGDADYNDLGFANIAGNEAGDFDLTRQGSPAVDTGVMHLDNQFDYFDRTRPNGGGPDIGAFEYYGGSSATTPPGTGMIGDTNSDGVINIVDALLVAQYYVGLNPAAFNPAPADADCDGDVDIVDALRIAQYYVGLISRFC